MQSETIGNATIYCGNALDILPPLGLAADLICSDPPYRTTSGGCTKGRMKGGIFAHSTVVPMLADITWPEIMDLCYLCAAGQSDAYFMMNDKHQFAAQQAALGAGWRIHNLLVWDKIAATANRWYMKNLEFTIYAWRGNARSIRNPSSKQLIRLPQVDESDHPTEKPVSLMMHYIENSTDPGDLVLDPFMGSGSTGVAALRLGRRFVGVELDPKHYATAARRIAGALRQPALFGESSGAAVQGDMLGGVEDGN